MKSGRSFLGGLLLALPAIGAAMAERDSYRFEVFLDEKPIGSHVFDLTVADGELAVESRADFDVRVFLVPVYAYRHVNRETWRDGCLQSIESSTDANGRDFAVNGSRGDGGYRIETLDGESSLAVDCLRSFAYWDASFVDQQRLVNSQDGEVVPVRVDRLPPETLTVESLELPVDVYRIRGAAADELDIKVFYHRQSGRWLALESRVGGDRVLRYLPVADERLASLLGNDR